MTVPQLIAAALALVPGLYAWWSGRRLSARPDDPALPELLLARRSNIWMLSFLAAFALIFVSAGFLRWIPLMVLGVLTGNYPLRRALFGESWGFGAYLLWQVRTFLVGSGFFLLLGLTPWLVMAARPHHWLAAAAAGAVLLAWEGRQRRVWLWLHGARPLARVDLRERFETIARAAGGTPPRVYQVGPRGARIAKAFALTGHGRGVVVFTDTLLELLTPDEAAAVFAHEVAHLAPRDARRRRRLYTWAAIGGAVAAGLLLATFLPEYRYLALMAGVFLALPLVAPVQVVPEEDGPVVTEGDRRALELAGNAETLVRALTKAHHYSLIPRPWPHGIARGAGDPRLAGRLEAILAAAGMKPEPARTAPEEA